MIRVNDTQDPQQGSQVLSGAQLVDTGGPLQRVFSAEKGEFISRLTTSPNPQRFLVAIGDPDAEEGIAPDVWYGVVESWRPSGSKVLVTARAARSVEESVHW
ncbi:hypothetical protein [Nocardia asiatica]|uniref:hypothetical protein n=1 Tax=Nocardia asiatica TaxID=209252 RepID=UPI0002E97CB3|nr:hypothetical protein [Nocardia asiatica]